MSHASCHQVNYLKAVVLFLPQQTDIVNMLMLLVWFTTMQKVSKYIFAIAINRVMNVIWSALYCMYPLLLQKGSVSRIFSTYTFSIQVVMPHSCDRLVHKVSLVLPFGMWYNFKLKYCLQYAICYLLCLKLLK